MEISGDPSGTENAKVYHTYALRVIAYFVFLSFPFGVIRRSTVFACGCHLAKLRSSYCRDKRLIVISVKHPCENGLAELARSQESDVQKRLAAKDLEIAASNQSVSQRTESVISDTYTSR